MSDRINNLIKSKTYTSKEIARMMGISQRQVKDAAKDLDIYLRDMRPPTEMVQDRVKTAAHEFIRLTEEGKSPSVREVAYLNECSPSAVSDMIKFLSKGDLIIRFRRGKKPPYCGRG